MRPIEESSPRARPFYADRAASRRRSTRRASSFQVRYVTYVLPSYSFDYRHGAWLMVSQTSSVLRAVNCRQQLRINIVHRLFAINLDQPAAFTVVINQRRGGPFVLFKSSDHRLRVIVTPLDEFRAIQVAKAVDLGRAEINIIYLAASGAGAPAHQPLGQSLLGNDYAREANLLALLRGQFFEQTRLVDRPRIPVEDIAIIAIRLRSPRA